MNRSLILGVTLLELIVSLAILSILATMAFPVVVTAHQRDKEIALREVLRTTRSAIDELHDDWKLNRISKLDPGISDNGYPKTLKVLVDGVDVGTAEAHKKRYLRALPVDPMSQESSEGNVWSLRGYSDDYHAFVWNGVDVYDIHSRSKDSALDGSKYSEW